MNRNKFWIVCLIGGLVCALVAGWWYVSTDPESNSSEFRIGMVLPLTGSAAEFGKHEQNAGQLFVNDWETDGEKQVKLALTFENSKGSGKDGVNAFQKMLTVDRPSAIYTELSSVSLAIAPIAERERIIMVSVAANPALTKQNRYAFRNFPDADRQAHEMAEHTLNSLSYEELAILYIYDDFGEGLYRAFKSRFMQRGGEVVAAESFPTEGTDFRAQVAKVLVSEPEAIYVVGYGKPLGTVIRQLREQGYNGPLLSGLEVSFDDVMTVAGDAAEGVIYLDIGFDPNSEDEKVARFVRAYRDRFGKTPSMVAALAYDGLSLLAEAFANVGDDADAVREHLLEVREYHGVCGTISINSNRDIVTPLVMKEIRNRKGVVWSLPEPVAN